MSLKGLKVRLKLLTSLLCKGTNGWIDDFTKEISDIGWQYAGVLADSGPFDLMAKLDARQFPVYDHLLARDFVGGDRALDSGWSSEPEVARLVANLAFALNAETVLETGCFVGFTTSHLATALSQRGGNRSIYVIDGEQRFLEMTASNLRQLGLVQPTVHLVCGRTQDAGVMAQVPSLIDFIFFDSDHSYNGVKREFEIYLPRLAKNGLAAVHDSILWPGVRRAVSELRDRFHVMTLGTSRGCGISVLRRR